MEISKFQASDLEELGERGKSFISLEAVAKVEKGPWSYTARIDGKIIGCAGVIEYWPGRGEAWAILAKGVGGYLDQITSAIKYKLAGEITSRRIEATVQYDFLPGHRWAEQLGFKMEAQRMVGYLPDGKDASLYALVRD